VDWTTYLTPDWLAAIGGIATALIALYLLGRDELSRYRQAKDQRSQQAAKFSISKGEWGRVKAHGTSYRGYVEFDLRNKSEDVISHVIITVRYHHNDSQGIGHGEVTHIVHRVDGDSEESVRVPIEATVLSPVVQSMLVHRVGMTFHDIAGRVWLRDEDHVLHELTRRIRRIQHRRRREELDIWLITGTILVLTGMIPVWDFSIGW
jgi:hypothetical protein